ncbi:unnamed protein product [Diatraea saccharalis]|uniref:MADF domain-containing protein n=1 Tax=Diatraea saccharalis TaxID=40085 RepID=A0A9N9WM69_9NEOP|nr:unnamed protein product [Diatraea saccharalis]CAG9796455.1 unnamed protein product [Diatraea saccharalis]
MSDIRSYSKEFLTQFIELYKSLPALWKIKSKEYSDRNKKNEAYHILIEKLKEVEPNATRDTVTKKINSLRSSRRKEQKKIKDSLRSGASTDDIYRTSLWYFELLEFVDDQETVRKPVSNFDSEQRPSSQLSTTNSNDPQSSSNEVGRSSTTRAFPPRHSGKRGASEVDDTISAIGKRLNESKEDSHDTFGRNVAHKL